LLCACLIISYLCSELISAAAWFPV
jgi:hypothetical protein